jgi:signal transduction histidine kinase
LLLPLYSVIIIITVFLDFLVSGEEYKCDNPCTEALYRVCQEAITNSIRHGKATRVVIVLRFNPDCLCLSIVDNGKGCGSIIKGLGLTGMEERVKRLNGTISYGPNGDEGFNISAEIPLAIST